jgi:8-oxo-dGTP diphosphatase
MIEVVCGVIVDQAGRVLACRRAPGMALAGQWEFPGGKPEPGESPRAALARELQEELGIAVLIGDPWPAVEHDYGPFAIRLQPFPCRITHGTPQPHEHDALRWLSAGELDAVEWAAADRPVVEHGRKFGFHLILP